LNIGISCDILKEELGKAQCPPQKNTSRPSQGKAIPDLVEICRKLPLDEVRRGAYYMPHAVNEQAQAGDSAGRLTIAYCK
jgi:hypothetical protein